MYFRDFKMDNLKYSVYIVEPADQGWIIEHLMRDISEELNSRGIPTRVGPIKEYKGEEIIFNSRFLQPLFDARAKVNSLFITHIDDKIKELELKYKFDVFNSFVCLSPQDADYIVALKGGRSGVVGIDLPTRDHRVRPIRLALFSACYEDGRKNEKWIAEYFRDKPSAYKQNFIFTFMGWGWEEYAAILGELEMNYEIYRYSRLLPGEYDLYKEKLPLMDALIYLGFDGGAMSVYDGITAGLDIIASNISYHQGLGESVKLFDDREGFFHELDSLYAKNTKRKAVLLQRSIAEYTSQLVVHWNSLLIGQPLDNKYNSLNPLGATELKTLKLYRSHYKRIDFSRIRSFLIRLIK
jgi:hypothetical protein